MHLGFSYIGFIFLIMLFVPNIHWAKNKPERYDEFAGNENKILLILERIGEGLVSTLLLIFKECNIRLHSIWLVWLVASFVLMILYELYWLRYFRSKKKMVDQYSNFAGFKVAGASLPVLAVLFIGIYAYNIFIIVAAIILGIGHIGIHLAHRKEALEILSDPDEEKSAGRISDSDEEKSAGSIKKRGRVGIGKKILRSIITVPVTILIILTIICIAVRNYNFFANHIDTARGIDEEIYVDINGQQQFITIRGRDKDSPVILYLHGGPGSPDSMIAYTYTNELIDEYTVVCWDQRGCGRTYVKNDDKDNDTVSFEQAEDDLDKLVDYLCGRFNCDKIIIMGHSYGSVLGSRYAYDHPEKTEAFIGIGQFVNFASSAKCEYEDALEKATEKGDDTSELTAAYDKFLISHTVDASSEMSSYAAPYHKAPRQKSTILAALVSPTLSTEDFLWFTKQLSFESFMKYNGKLMDYLMSVDLREEQKSYEVPVFFISGGCDWNCAWNDMVDYAEKAGVKYDLIEDCGHYVHCDAPEEFAKIVKEDLASVIQQ